MFKLTMSPVKTLLLVIITVALLGPVSAQAATAAEIDAKVATALAAFRKDVTGADEYLKSAKGVLVIPDVKKIGFVVAAQWGFGMLRVDGQNVGYYKMEAGSAGFQAGFQKTNFVFIFFTNEALDKFRSGKGWTAGVETGITLVEANAGVAADTLKNQNAVAGFAFGNEGLMGGWSAKGTKFTSIEPE